MSKHEVDKKRKWDFKIQFKTKTKSTFVIEKEVERKGSTMTWYFNYKREMQLLTEVKQILDFKKRVIRYGIYN